MRPVEVADLVMFLASCHNQPADYDDLLVDANTLLDQARTTGDKKALEVISGCAADMAENARKDLIGRCNRMLAADHAGHPSFTEARTRVGKVLEALQDESVARFDPVRLTWSCTRNRNCREYLDAIEALL